MKRATTDVDIFGNNSNSKPTYQTDQGELEQPTTSQHSQENNDFELIPHQYNNNDYFHSTPSSTPISWRSSHNSCGCKNNELTEKTLELISFFQLIGRKDVLDTTRRILSKIVGQNLSKSYNWCGKNNKPAFNRFKNVINFVVGVVRKNKFNRDVTQQEVETIIKSRLRIATNRNGGRNKRRNVKKFLDDVRQHSAARMLAVICLETLMPLLPQTVPYLSQAIKKVINHIPFNDSEKLLQGMCRLDLNTPLPSKQSTNIDGRSISPCHGEIKQHHRQAYA
ncbi:hypothetical protein FQA39_LY03204 [Lamprigera yunnana]|nr:hypothetical protein FQA39_LY03204 [Lamprigera yunnana]